MIVRLHDASSGLSPLIVSNRGPYEVQADGRVRRGSGGLVSAMSSFAEHMGVPWVACARTELERRLAQESTGPDRATTSGISAHYVASEPETFRKHYSVVSNQTLWPIHHGLPSFVSRRSTAEAWRFGYTVVNGLVAEGAADVARRLPGLPALLLQDYHLYLAAPRLRELLPGAVLQQFIHVPWPESRYWGALPQPLLRELLTGLLANDIVGFQTAEDAARFLGLCQASRLVVDRARSRVLGARGWVRIANYPISVDPGALRRAAHSEPSQLNLRQLLLERPEKVILRVDRIDPAKNARRGFEAFERLLSEHPEWLGRVQFWAFLQPSRQDAESYRAYADQVKDVVSGINRRYRRRGWQPIRLEIWDNLPRALAAYQLFDVLLVNSIRDGMNLVAKEGMILNRRGGVLVLSRTAGAHAEIGRWAVSIDPDDVAGTARGLHEGLVMPGPERERRAREIRSVIEKHDLNRWIEAQLADLYEVATSAQIVDRAG